MNWQVRIGDKSVVVTLPDVLVDGQAFPLTVEGKASTALWHRATSTLVIREPSGLERLWRLRAHGAERFDGDSATRVSAELQDRHGMRAIAASVDAHVPGQESRGGAKAKQGLVVRSQITG